MNEQIDLFSYAMPKFKIDKPIRLIELFGGIGAQAKALENLGVNFEHYRMVEIDKYACASYNAVHHTNFEPMDITEIHADDLGITETDKYCYIMTYSFPCQDLSLAGNQKGMTKGSGTRSGLLWEVERLLDECESLPQVLLMENVPQVIGQKNITDFQGWRRKLESLGYSNYVQLLNSKDYGIPQNRNRCFMVSILGEYHYNFPKKQKLKLRLKDMLEDKVDEKYYLSDEVIKNFVINNEKNALAGNGFRFEPSERERERVSKTIQPKMDRPEVNYLKDFYSKDGLCPTLPASTGMKEPPKMFAETEVSHSVRGGEEEALTDINGISLSTNKLGYVESGTGEHESNRVYSSNGLSRTLQARDWKGSMMVGEDKKIL